MTQVVMEVPAHLAPHARRVEAAGLALHCYVAGDPAAPPVVLVHGLADEADTWRRVLLPLAERHRVIAPDLPGFGRSDLPPGACSVAAYARAVAALMAALGVGRAALVGSSMGAMVCQRLALAAPQLVERLVLVGGCLPVRAQPLSGPLLAFLTPGLGERIYTGLRRSRDEAYATLRPYYADLDALPEEEREFLRARVWARVWSDRQRAAFFSALRWAALDGLLRPRQYRDRLAACRVPTRLVWGGSDHVSSLGGAEAVRALAPGARLDLIPGSGHLPQQERPEELLALIG